MGKPISQHEIARKIGVSRTTVSLVLNGKKINISEEKKNAVLTCARKMGYLKTIPMKHTGNIGYIVPRHASISDPYFHRFFIGVEEKAKEIGYNVLIRTHDSGNNPFKNLLNNVNGIIILDLISEDYLQQIPPKFPTVLLNWCSSQNKFDAIMSDNITGIKKVVNYLFQLGHRKIGFFAIKPLGCHHEERYRGYLDALKELNLPIEENYIFIPEIKTQTIEETDSFAERYLRNLRNLPESPTAIVCPTDIYGISMLKLGPGLGYKIPDNLSIFGYDYTLQCLQFLPTLSSVNQPMEEMGKQAVNFILERIHHPDTLSRKILFDVELKIMGSVAPSETNNTNTLLEEGRANG